MNGLTAMAPLLDALGSTHSSPIGPMKATYREGDAVRVVGLTSVAGAPLNEKEGRVQHDELNESGRAMVFVVGRTVWVKPENLRPVLVPEHQLEASAADADAELTKQVRALVSLMNEPAVGNADDSQFHGLKARLCRSRDPKAFRKLATHADSIFASFRQWSDVSRDPSRLYVHGYEDGSTHIICGSKKEDGADWCETQMKMLTRVSRSVSLLGALMHITTIRRKAQQTDIIELSADMIMAPIFHPYALETALQCTSSLLNNPGTSSDSRHLWVLSRFFRDEGPGCTRRPMYDRLRQIYEQVGELTFTRDCVTRILRWSVAHMTSASATTQILGVCREVIAECSESSEDMCWQVHCSSDICLNVESGEPFKKCAGCGIARYCSRKCQKYDWKHGGHKADCRAVSKV